MRERPIGITETVGVADAKRRFSELIERVRQGERFLVVRHGRPAVGLVPPDEAAALARGEKQVGLAAAAGALADWEELDAAIAEVYRARRGAKDRSVQLPA